MTISLLRNYQKLTRSRSDYGDLKKCEFHIHTPASHDYRLIPNKLYKNLTEVDVVKVAYEMEMLTEEQRDFLFREIESGYFEGDDYRQQLQKTPFTCFKDYLAFKLVAHKLYENEIQVAVVSDHNTVDGYKKLVYALDEYFKERIKGSGSKHQITLLLGIEISCSETIHLVGIFDNPMYFAVQRLIEECIPSKVFGTYETSLSMIEKINKIGGISYIAHINSTNWSNTTQLYKQTLFNHPSLNVVGITSTDKEGQLSKINSYTMTNPNEKFCVIHEGDSHQLDELGKKNTWIKMSKASFNSLKKAFINHKICVFITKPDSTNKYIKGLLIDPGDEGYLRGRKVDEPFVVDFSSDLNCIIGGRGTGKSTMLNILEVVFTLEVLSMPVLRFICKNKFILVYFVYLQKEYLLRFIPQLKKNHVSSDRSPFEEKAFVKYEKNSKKIILEHHWIELYQISKSSDSVNFNIILDVEEKRRILNNVYRKSYSINNIVEQINNSKIGDFIKEVIFNGLPFERRDEFLETFKKLPKTRLRTFLAKDLPLLHESMDKRKIMIESNLQEFNMIHHNQLNIVYSPKAIDSIDYIEILTDPFISHQFLSGYNITWGGVERFIISVSNKIGFMKFLTHLFQNSFKKIEEHVSILDYQSDKQPSFFDVDQERKNAEKKDLNIVYGKIRDKLLTDRNKLVRCFQNYFEVIDDFSILFNTNSKEIVTTLSPNMKDINEISLGQKVVAILTFIFEYGKHFNDNTPLIIDQPEDNLDNQYIYKNLVNSLKQIKNNRQIIVVTHSSTIVTNADAEQVIVLDSNSQNGWIEKKGYPDHDVVTRHIINYLEGGEESFKHKIGMYNKVLQK